MDARPLILGVDDSLTIRKALEIVLKPAGYQLELAADGADIQLHTHRHRTPLDRELFLREIEDNRQSIQAMTGLRASHFCYPSGVYDQRFLPWLEEAGIVSATTCETGFAARTSHPLLLPRFVDNAALSSIEFEGWLSGVSAALPRRRERKANAA